MIIKNIIRCKKCGDIIESTSVHDFKWCKCKACAVDGGHDYLKRIGDLDDWEDLSIIKTDMQIKEEKTDGNELLFKKEN